MEERKISDYFYDSALAFLFNDKLCCPSAVKLINDPKEIDSFADNEFNKLVNVFDMFYLKVNDVYVILMYNVYLSKDLQTYYLRLDDIPNTRLKFDNKPLPNVDGTLRASKIKTDIRNYLKKVLVPALREYYKGTNFEFKDKNEEAGQNEDNWMIGFITNGDFQNYVDAVKLTQPLTPYTIILNTYDYNRMDDEAKLLEQLPPSKNIIAYKIFTNEYKDKDNNLYNQIFYKDYFWIVSGFSLSAAFKEDTENYNPEINGEWQLLRED